jgi:hypothetical protein
MSGPLLDAAAVLDDKPETCRLARPFSVDDLDLDTMATVSVTGYDGAHQPRVSGTNNIPNLRDGPVHISLKAIEPLNAILLLDRGNLRAGSLTDITSIALFTAMRPAPILTVTKEEAGAYFSIEPAAYAFDLTLVSGSDLNAETTTTASTIVRTRLTLTLMSSLYYVATPL